MCKKESKATYVLFVYKRNGQLRLGKVKFTDSNINYHNKYFKLELFAPKKPTNSKTYSNGSNTN